MPNEEKIIKLLEEIRDQQKENLQMALSVQKKMFKRVFWFAFIAFLLIIISKL